MKCEKSCSRASSGSVSRSWSGSPASARNSRSAVGNGSLFKLDAGRLQAAIRADRDLGVSLLWSFWQTLADKVRASNAQMSELFDMPIDAANADHGSSEPGHPIQIGEEAKLDILREQIDGVTGE